MNRHLRRMSSYSPIFSKCPPSLSKTKFSSVLVLAISSLIRQKSPNSGDGLLHLDFRGLPAHHPNRTPNIVKRNASAGEVWNPEFELAAAPETAIAVPRR